MFSSRLQQGDGAAHALLNILEVYAVISLKIDLAPRLRRADPEQWIKVERNGYVES
jgi:hypothetical protein